MTLRKLTLTLFFCFSYLLTAQTEDEPHAKMPKRFMAFFDNYCMDCHDSDTEKGDFNLETLPFDIEDIKTAELWKHVLNSLNAGEMPPEDKDQPKAKEKADFLNALSEVMVQARKSLSDSGGEITLRRLNKREYINSIESLLGVRVNAEDLPDDSSSYGFDTSGKSLFFSSDQLEQYLALAKDALSKMMVPTKQPKPIKNRLEGEVSSNKFVKKTIDKQEDVYKRAMAWKANQSEPATKYGFIDSDRVNFELRTYRENYQNAVRYTELPQVDQGTYLCFFRPIDIHRFNFSNKTVSGRFVFKVKLGLLDQESKDCFIDFGTGKGREFNVIDCYKVNASIDKPQIIEIPVDYQVGDPSNFAIRLRVPNNYKSIQQEYFKSIRKHGVGPKPNIWVDWTEVEGPIYEEWPPKNYQALFPPLKKKWADDNYAKEVISSFSKKAFRGKTISEEYLKQLFLLYRESKVSGEKFHVAIQEPLAVILTSPSFLYLPEPTTVKAKHRKLDERELAVRLAYFLWSAPPDEELLKLSKQGRLSEPKVLSGQVERMLKDARSYSFVSAFCHQWLGMDRLNFFQFNINKYYDFDESAKKSAKEEVYHTFNTIMKDDLALHNLLKSKFIVIDELLAEYYGIANVAGDHFRKVSLESDSKRGGLMGMAAILAMGSDGENSSPVERGAWMLRHVLNDPPPPAPPNVPQLGEIGEGSTKREMLASHTKEPQCAQCHRKIDPIGFGLENFNAAGKWIETEIVRTKVIEENKKKKRKKPKIVHKEYPIVTSGKFYKGPSFESFEEMRDIVAKKRVAFTTGFVENLIEYALGRPYGFTDDDLAEMMVSKAKQDGFKISTMIKHLVNSREFKSK